MAEKNKVKKSKIAIIIFVVTALVATVFTTVLALGEKNEGYRTITVIEISGTVGVVHNDTEYPAYTGMHLEEGYSVVTSGNSYIRMLLDDDKYVKLEAGSKAVFEELSGGKTAIRIERGSLVSEITKPLAVDEDFIVNTPNAVLAVRGTLFRVDLSRTEKGELNTDVMTYGGAVSSKRVQPDGKTDEVEVTITEGFKARVNMDDKKTVYMVDEVKIDIEHLVGNSSTNTDGNNTTTETNVNGEVVTTAPITLESVLKPIAVEDIPDDDLVDIYFASENGHQMFVETEQIEKQIEKRDIDVTTKTSVYEVAEKVENPVEIAIPNDNVPLATTTEPVTEAVVVIQGPPTDGLGTTTTHTHKEITETVQATCTKEGKTTVKCSDCNQVISETPILATGHTIVSKITTQPTCKSKGSRTDSCSVCGEIVAVVELAMSGHTEKTMTANPTCTTTGKTVVSCTVCGEKISETIKNATGHTIVSSATPATCTEKGVRTDKCKVCDEVVSVVELSATGHKEIYSGTKDSHTECETCGEILSVKHTFKEVIVEPTCTTNGSKTYSCECGYIYEEKTSALGHATETTVVDATCTVAGSKTTKCTVCDEILETVVLAATGHIEKKTTVEPTCTETGKTTVTCTVCNETISETSIDALGHTEKTTTVEPTCTEAGKTTVTCAVCNEPISETVLVASGHTEVNGGTDAVHTKCSVCDLPLVTEHELQETVNQKEDCVTDGLYTYSCECGYEYSETVAKLGHTEVDGAGADVHTKCETCGETLKDGTYHSYSDEIITPNSCTSTGVLTHTCACGWSYTEEIPASHTKSADGLSCSACGGAWVDLNSVNFPDSVFLSYIKTNFNTDPYVTDEALIGDEITDVTTINVSGDSQTDGGYNDLTGIKNFVNLTNVNCSYNANIETLDLSGLTGLTNLDITGLTGLKTLNISGCTNLTEDRITGLDTCTALTELNVSGCVNFAELNLNSNTKIETLDLSGCSALTSLVIDDSSTTYPLQSIDLSGCTSLEVLTLNNALSLTTIDFTDTSAIKTIDLGGCQGITGTLDVSNKTNLTSITIGGLIRVTSLNVTGCTSLASIDASACSGLTTIVGISDCTALTTLTLNGTGLTSVDVTNNSSLTSLNVANCSSLTNLNATRSTESTTLSSLTLTNCTALKTLNLYNCKGITTLDATTLTALEELNLTYSGVTTFNSATDTMSFSQNANLKNVYLNGISSFTGFDISANTLLEEFALTDNSKVTSLDFSNSASLKKLTLSDVTALNTLDVSACTVLENFNVLNTGLTSLSVTGSSVLTQFWVYNNTSLESLSLIGATSLTSVKLSAGTENTVLTSLSITDCGITSLDVTNLTKLTTLDVSGCTGLTALDVSGSAVASLDVTDCTALKTLDVSDTTISSLDVSTCIMLTDLNVSGCTNISELDVSACTSLVNLNTSGTAIVVIDITNCTSLALLDASDCTNLDTLTTGNVSALTDLNISGCTSLTSLDISTSTELVSLNVSGTAIEMLDACYSENIETIEASDCTSMTTFCVAPETNDKLTSINVSGCTAMTNFQLDNSTALENLNLSGLTSLTSVYLYQTTGIKTIDVSNTMVSSLDLSACADLSSIVATNSRLTLERITLPAGKDESIITGLS